MKNHRWHEIPEEVARLSLIDAEVAAACHVFNQSDLSLVDFLSRLVVVLASTKSELLRREIERLERLPPA